MISPLNPDVVLSAGYIYIPNAYWSQFSLTTDGGLTWRRDTLDSMSRANTAVFDPNDASRVYLAGDSAYSYPYLRASTDLGQTWQRLGTGIAGSILAFFPVAGSPNLFFCGTTTGLYKSTDAGLTWARQGTMTNVRSVALDPVYPNALIYCGTSTGVYVSPDGGNAWEPYNDGLGVTDILSLALRRDPEPVLFAGTNGGSVYRRLAPASVARPTDPLNPRTPGLMNPFSLLPNPCSGRARLSVARCGPARVTVSDVAGRRVWSGRLAATDNGVVLPSLNAGVYLVRLVSETGRATQKLVVQE